MIAWTPVLILLSATNMDAVGCSRSILPFFILLCLFYFSNLFFRLKTKWFFFFYLFDTTVKVENEILFPGFVVLVLLLL